MLHCLFVKVRPCYFHHLGDHMNCSADNWCSESFGYFRRKNPECEKRSEKRSESEKRSDKSPEFFRTEKSEKRSEKKSPRNAFCFLSETPYRLIVILVILSWDIIHVSSSGLLNLPDITHIVHSVCWNRVSCSDQRCYVIVFIEYWYLWRNCVFIPFRINVVWDNWVTVHFVALLHGGPDLHNFVPVQRWEYTQWSFSYFRRKKRNVKKCPKKSPTLKKCPKKCPIFSGQKCPKGPKKRPKKKV